MGDIAQRGNRLTFAKGGRAGFFGGARVIKGATKLLKEHAAKKEAKKVQAGKDKIQKSEMGYAKGGRAGKFAGGVIKGGKKIVKEIVDKIKTGKSNKFDTWETIGIPGSPGPKKGKYPAIDKVMKNIEKQKKKGIKEPGYDPDFKAKGGRIGKAAGGRIGKKWGKIVRPTRSRIHEMLGGGEKGKPHSTKEGRQASGKRLLRRTYEAAKEHVKSTAKKDTESVKDVR